MSVGTGDCGYGIRSVEITTDGGNSWDQAVLGEDLGRFAFRPWTFVMAARRGMNAVTVRATNSVGQSQSAVLIANPAGYHHNVMHTVAFEASLPIRPARESRRPPPAPQMTRRLPQAPQRLSQAPQMTRRFLPERWWLRGP
jgi:hypothetical protein